MRSVQWDFRRHHSAITRAREVDPDADFEVEALADSAHSSRIASVDRDGVYLLDLHDAGGVDITGAIRADALTAVFVWGEKASLNGAPADVPEPRLLTPGTEFRLHLPAAYRIMRIGIRGIALSRLESVRPHMEGKRVRPVAVGLRFSKGDEAELQRHIIVASRFARVATERGIDVRHALAAAAAEAEEALATAIGRAMDAPAVPDSRPARATIVTSAIDLLTRDPTEPKSVSALCASLGVGERRLQRAFRDRMGIGPRAFERERRLRGCHGAILSEGDRRSITDIAMSYGFWHLGRFSAAYAALYGCPPGEMRRRVWSDT